MPGKDFYCRYYVGHKGKFGHEFLEFEFQADGKVRSTAVVVCMPCASCSSWAGDFLYKPPVHQPLGAPTNLSINPLGFPQIESLTTLGTSIGNIVSLNLYVVELPWENFV
jgi:hypothetical protein